MNLIFDMQNAWHKSYHIAFHIYGDKLNEKLLTQKFLIDFGYSIRLFKEHNSIDKVICCFDAQNNFRKKLNKKYKANREVDKQQFFYDGINNLYRELNQQGFICTKIDGLEADDCIGFWVRELKDSVNCIFSNDEDIRQLINKNTFVYNNQSFNKTFFFDENNLTHYDVKGFSFDMSKLKKVDRVNPNFILFSKMILGCDGDNVSSLVKKGIGEKTLKKKIFDKIKFDRYSVNMNVFEEIAGLINTVFNTPSITVAELHNQTRLVQLTQTATYGILLCDKIFYHINLSKFNYNGDYQFI